MLKGHAGPVKAVVITSDNRYIVSYSDDKTLRIWSVKNRKNKAVLNASSWIWKLLITLNNKYIIACAYNTLEIWDIKKQKISRKKKNQN